jgi:hypothetical protein
MEQLSIPRGDGFGLNLLPNGDIVNENGDFIKKDGVYLDSPQFNNEIIPFENGNIVGEDEAYDQYFISSMNSKYKSPEVDNFDVAGNKSEPITQADSFDVAGNKSEPILDQVGNVAKNVVETVGKSFFDQQQSNAEATEDTLKGIIKGSVRGVGEAMKATAELVGIPFDTMNKYVVNPIAELLGFEKNDDVFMGSESNLKALDMYVNTVNDIIPVGIADPTNQYLNEPFNYETYGNIVEEVAKFGITAVPAAKIVGMMSSANAIVRGFAWGGIADYMSMNPEDPAIATFLVDYFETDREKLEPWARNAISVLEKHDTDGVITKRLKNMMEGTIAGGLAEGILPLVKGIIKATSIVPWAKTVTPLVGGAGVTYSDDAEGSVFSSFFKALSTSENQAIKKTLSGIKNPKVSFSEVKNEALRVKNQYRPDEGWLPIEINAGGTAPSFKLNKKGKIELKWNLPMYGFHIHPGKKLKGADEAAANAQHKSNLVNKMVTDVSEVVKRANSGDQAAIDIINQASWYRSMRTRLRKEFGGMADVFADIIGATSAQTNVQQNYENAIGVLRQFTKGDFDAEIKLFKEKIDAGENLNSETLTNMHKDPNNPFKLITKASGALFNTNSPAATMALLDMFRQVKKGGSPKTVNFTGNLIGFGNDATIDVWAARYLRDAAGLPRIPPPAEKAVAGKHLTGSNLEDPKIGSEFGFGQEVFGDAVKIINQNGEVKAFNSEIGEMGADDLQAVVWFLEKEKWTKNNWTTKAGEGGSLDFESVYGGSPDFGRTKELRSIINSVNSSEADKIKAAEELKTLEGAPQRTVAGVAMQRPGEVPTNMQQSLLANEVTVSVQNDPKVIGFQANNTIGRFDGGNERSLNLEVTAQTDFDPASLISDLVKAGKKYNQDSVFISKVVDADTPNARPGGEVYFKTEKTQEELVAISEILKKYDIDGFTFVTDARQSDRAVVQSGGTDQTAKLTGIRFQYIPEFDGTASSADLATIMAKKVKVYLRAMNEMRSIDGVTYADVVYYDTKVYVNKSNPDTGWIDGGIGYDEVRTIKGRNVSGTGSRSPNSPGS